MPDALSTLPPKPFQSTVARASNRPMAPETTYCRRDRIEFSRVAFVAHCLLNQNSKTDGGARCPGIYSPLVDLLRERGWRIEQMPCPEHAFLGMHRFWLVKDQADTLAFRRHCRRQAKVVAGAIAVHVERGTDVVVIGVEGSPSMGVRITSSSADWGGRPDKGDDDYPLVPGRGIFSEELVAELAERGLGDVRASGIEHQLPSYDEAAEREQISALLEQPSGR